MTHDTHRMSEKWKLRTAIMGHARWIRCLLVGVLSGAGWVAAGGGGNAPVVLAQPPRDNIMAPPELANTDWLETLRAAQLKTIGRCDVYHDFRFVDRIADSRITFRHRIVSDAGRTYKGVHYDHGNGLAVADVDGDGLLDVYFTTQVGSNGLWRNLGGGRFEDWTERAGVGVACACPWRIADL